MKQSKKERQQSSTTDRKAKSLRTGDKKLNGPNRPST
ncbi:spore protein [Oceanobacillus longus]|uniref:Spore protein n=1 Tax=Oceanobacillus longus TaxID=930120 RepID=A0ABV8GVN3_9BACI